MVQAAIELEAGARHRSGGSPAHPHTSPTTKRSRSRAGTTTSLRRPPRKPRITASITASPSALVAGEVTSRQFTDEWLRNPIVCVAHGKTTLEENPEFTRLFKAGRASCRGRGHDRPRRIQTRRSASARRSAESDDMGATSRGNSRQKRGRSFRITRRTKSSIERSPSRTKRTCVLLPSCSRHRLANRRGSL